MACIAWKLCLSICLTVRTSVCLSALSQYFLCLYVHTCMSKYVYRFPSIMWNHHNVWQQWKVRKNRIETSVLRHSGSTKSGELGCRGQVQLPPLFHYNLRVHPNVKWSIWKACLLYPSASLQTVSHHRALAKRTSSGFTHIRPVAFNFRWGSQGPHLSKRKRRSTHAGRQNEALL